MVHQYKNNGYNIILDVNSGSVHVVDDVVYDVVPLMEEALEGGKSREDAGNAVFSALDGRYAKEDVEDAFNQVMELYDAGMLYAPDIYKDYIIDFKKRETVVKALCLHIAHDCNLACRYCFAEEGEYHGRRALMSFEVGKKALDFLVKNSGDRKSVV